MVRDDGGVTLDGHADVAAIAPVRRVATAAPLWRRFVALLLDDAVLPVLPVLLAALLIAAGGPRSILFALAGLAAVVIVVMNDIVLVTRSGQSLGRRVLSIQVLDTQSMLLPSLGQVILRTFIGGAMFGIGWHPFGFLPSFLVIVSPWPIICYAPALADRRWHRGLNDRWAHTVVICLPPEDSPARSRSDPRPTSSRTAPGRRL